MVDQGFYPRGEPLPTLLDRQARVTRLREAMLLAIVEIRPMMATETLEQERKLRDWVQETNRQLIQSMMVPPELLGLPVARDPEELAELAATFGTAVMVVTGPASQAPIEGEILPPETKEEKMDRLHRMIQDKAEDLEHFQDAMMYAVLMGMPTRSRS